MQSESQHISADPEAWGHAMQRVLAADGNNPRHRWDRRKRGKIAIDINAVTALVVLAAIGTFVVIYKHSTQVEKSAATTSAPGVKDVVFGCVQDNFIYIRPGDFVEFSQDSTRHGPGRFFGVKCGTQVSLGEPLDGSYSFGVLVRRLGRVVAGNSA